MRYMILVKATKDSEAGVMPQESLFHAMATYHEALQKAGLLVDASGLQPSAKGWRIRYDGEKRSVVDGPFPETKELVAGYTTIQVKSREEAIEWTRRFPNPSHDGGKAEIEVRRFYELEDFEPSEAIERFREMEAGNGAAPRASDELEVRRFISEQMRAIESKDVDRIMSFYAPTMVAFDAVPPYQTTSLDVWRRAWAHCLPCFPEKFAIEPRDLRVTVSGDLAFAHWMFRFTSDEKDHPATQSYLRITAGYQRIDGEWKVVHEHLSVPFDPMTSKAVFTGDPDEKSGTDSN